MPTVQKLTEAVWRYDRPLWTGGYILALDDYQPIVNRQGNKDGQALHVRTLLFLVSTFQHFPWSWCPRYIAPFPFSEWWIGLGAPVPTTSKCSLSIWSEWPKVPWVLWIFCIGNLISSKTRQSSLKISDNFKFQTFMLMNYESMAYQYKIRDMQDKGDYWQFSVFKIKHIYIHYDNNDTSHIWIHANNKYCE